MCICRGERPLRKSNICEPAWRGIIEGEFAQVTSEFVYSATGLLPGSFALFVAAGLPAKGSLFRGEAPGTTHAMT